jgi:hypothetical protein
LRITADNVLDGRCMSLLSELIAIIDVESDNSEMLLKDEQEKRVRYKVRGFILHNVLHLLKIYVFN